jgi:hypothetical protein
MLLGGWNRARGPTSRSRERGAALFSRGASDQGSNQGDVRPTLLSACTDLMLIIDVFQSVTLRAVHSRRCHVTLGRPRS